MKISVATVRGIVGLLSGLAFGLVLTSSRVFAVGMLPVLSLVSPGNGATMSGSMMLAAAADAEGLVSLQFKIDGNDAGPLITAGSCPRRVRPRQHPCRRRFRQRRRRHPRRRVRHRH